MEIVAYRGVNKSVYRDKKGVERHVKNNESASPIFFSEDQRYASQYGDMLIKAKIKLNKVFDTKSDPVAVDIFNNYFRGSEFDVTGADKIELGQPVSFVCADYLWSYLSMNYFYREHTPNAYDGEAYDGIVVNEGMGHGKGETWEGVMGLDEKANTSIVPIDRSNITIINIKKLSELSLDVGI